MPDRDERETDESRSQEPRLPNVSDAALFYLLLIIVLFAGIGLLFTIVQSLGYSTTSQGFVSVGIILQAALTIGLVLLAIRTRKYNLTATLRLRKSPAILYPIAIGGLISISMLTGHLATILIDLFPELLSDALIELVRVSRAGDMSTFILFSLAISIGPAISEELAFRGIIMRGLERSAGASTAIWISAFVFALFHFDPLHIILVFPAGFFLGYLVVHSGSIYPAIVAHGANNLWATLEANFWFATNPDIEPAKIITQTSYSTELLVLITGVLILSLYGLHRFVSERASSNLTNS